MIKTVTFVAFSGGCFAGKSTTIDHVAGILKKDGYAVFHIDELMRHEKIVSIDNLRSNTEMYFEVEKKIISQRILFEVGLFEDPKEIIVLADRAISDNLFYYTFYMRPDLLPVKQLVEYNNVLIDLITQCKFSFQHLYDKVYFFEPINGENEDLYRPEKISTLKLTESLLIDNINKSFLPADKPYLYTKYNYNFQPRFDVYNKIADEIKSIFRKNKQIVLNENLKSKKR